MKTKLIKQFVMKTATKIILFAVLVMIITGLTLPVGYVISNEIAMAQMENSNEAYILMSTYNNIKHIAGYAWGIIVGVFVCGIVRDIYKFVKTVSKEDAKN